MGRQFLAALVLLLLCVRPADAAAGRFVVVVDASSKRPLELVRVTIDGHDRVPVFTDEDGRAPLTGLPSGTYTIRIFKAGYAPKEVEVQIGQDSSIVQADLTRTWFASIGQATAKTGANLGSNQDEATRLNLGSLDGSLALDPELDIDPEALLEGTLGSLGLEGRDSGATGTSLNGLPLSPTGSLSAVNSDLFSSAQVEHGSAYQTSSDSVNFSGPEFTTGFVGTGRYTLGSFGTASERLSASGSLGKFQFVETVATRNVLTGLSGKTYLDSSGLDYEHDAGQHTVGSMLAIREQYSDSGQLEINAVFSGADRPVICTRFTALIPCGYGPGPATTSRLSSFQLTDTVQGPASSLSISAFDSAQSDLNDESTQLLYAIPFPNSTQQFASVNGLAGTLAMPIHDGVISLSTIVAQGFFNYSALQDGSALAAHGRLGFTKSTVGYDHNIAATALHAEFSENTGSNQAGTIIGKVSIAEKLPRGWQTKVQARTDIISSSLNLPQYLPVPQSSTIFCGTHQALVNALSDVPRNGTTREYRADLVQKDALGTIALGLSDATDYDASIADELSASDIPDSLPTGYLTELNSIVQSSIGCGPSAKPLESSNLYLRTTISGLKRHYQSAHIAAVRHVANRWTWASTLVFSDAHISSEDPRILAPSSILSPGLPVPYIPEIRGNVLASYRYNKQQPEFDLLLQYEGNRNRYGVPPFSLLRASTDIPFRSGDIVFSVSNILNKHSGSFSTPATVPYRSYGGQLAPTLAFPVQPRAIGLAFVLHLGSPDTSAAAPDRADNITMLPSRVVYGLRKDDASRAFTPIKSQICTSANSHLFDVIARDLKEFTTSSIPSSSTAEISLSRLGSDTVVLEPLSIKALQAIQLCSRLHQGSPAQASALGLNYNYVDESTDARYYWNQSIGLYFIHSDQLGTAIRLRDLPPKLVGDPLAIDQDCRDEDRAPVELLLDSFRRYLAQPSSSSSVAHLQGWDVQIHDSGSPHEWYELQPADATMYSAIVRCAIVYSVSSRQLQNLGLSAANEPNISFAPSVGLYVRKVRL